MKIETRLEELGLTLPELSLSPGQPLVLPPGARLPFPWVRVCGKRAFISGHGAQQESELALQLSEIRRFSCRAFWQSWSRGLGITAIQYPSGDRGRGRNRRLTY